MARSPLKKNGKTSPWKHVNKKTRSAGKILRKASFWHAEFKGKRKAMTSRLAQAEDWATNVLPSAFAGSKYPIEIFLPVITSKLSRNKIASFNIYFMASMTLKQAPEPSEYTGNPRILKGVEKQRDEKFGKDSVSMECSRDNCRRRMLCYGARAIKERGGSSYDQWYCYQPKVNKEEAAIVTANKTQKKESIPNERQATSPSQNFLRPSATRPSLEQMPLPHQLGQNKPLIYIIFGSKHPTKSD